MQHKVSRKGCGASMLTEGAILPAPLCIHQHATSPTLSFWVFLEASLHSHDLLNHWPLVIDSASWSSTFSGGWRGRTESSNTLITWLALLAASPHPSLGWGEGFKNHLINVTEEHLLRLSVVKLPGFGELCARNGAKTKYIFIITNHNAIT